MRGHLWFSVAMILALALGLSACSPIAPSFNRGAWRKGFESQSSAAVLVESSATSDQATEESPFKASPSPSPSPTPKQSSPEAATSPSSDSIKTMLIPESNEAETLPLGPVGAVISLSDEEWDNFFQGKPVDLPSEKKPALIILRLDGTLQDFEKEHITQIKIKISQSNSGTFQISIDDLALQQGWVKGIESRLVQMELATQWPLPAFPPLKSE